MSAFEILGNPIPDSQARRGQLHFEGRRTILTPHYIALSSRGTVPHLTPDMMHDETSITGLYVGLEECGETPLRKFIALQEDALLILGPRRVPAVPSPIPNTYTSIAINTSYGFKQMEISSYVSLSNKIRPDVIIAPVDHFIGDEQRVGAKRKDKMDERSVAWMKAAQGGGLGTGSEGARSLWAPILPLPSEVQKSYLEHLEESGSERFGGVVVYDDDSVLDVPKMFERLPRLSISIHNTPQTLLRAIDLGIDILTVPFIGVATDAGVALVFVFPASTSSSASAATGAKLPLGFSLWDTAYDTDLSPLIPGCTCYACRSHHRAYIRHLLNTKEMLAWVLLQIHNHHQLDLFLSRVRHSIAQSTFVEDAAAFSRAYADTLPTDGGQGPRIRGYQLRQVGAGRPKANQPAYKQWKEPANLEAIEAAKALKKATKLNDEAQKLAEEAEDDVVLPDFMAL